MVTNIYLYTAFAFMVCDGDIAEEELKLIKVITEKYIPSVNDINRELGELVDKLNVEGKQFLQSYLEYVEEANLSKGDALNLLKLAVKVVHSDNEVKYSEVKFFKAVRSHLHSIDDEYILENIAEIDDFWLEADVNSNSANIERDYFDNIELPTFNLNEIEEKSE